MYPESNYPLQKARRINFTPKQLLFIGIGVIIVILTIIAAFLVTQPTLKQYGLTKTNLRTEQNFGYLSGSNIYAFNGLAFYKTNLADSKVTMLSSGNKLPVPSKIFWADDSGALMNFSSSFMLSKVDDALRAKGQEIAYGDSNDYTWYLDFKSGALKLVSTRPIVAELAYYSEQQNGFYYIGDASDVPGVITPLYFYDIKSDKNETVAGDLQVTDMDSMQSCPDSDSLCFIARDLTNTTQKKLYSIKRGEKKKIVFEATGKIFPTNNPDLYIITSREATPPSTSREYSEQDADISDEPASLYTITTKTTRELGFKVGTIDPLLHFVNDKQFYVVGGSTGNDPKRPLYYSGEITDRGPRVTTFGYTYTDGSEFSGLLNRVNGHGSGSFVLATTLEGDQVLFGDTVNTPTLAIPNITTASRITQECLASGPQNIQYFSDTRLYRILLTDDSTFNQNIAKFSQCVIAKSPSALGGYNFEFIGTDPVNGRITTD